jgi:hypothetical protein
MFVRHNSGRQMRRSARAASSFTTSIKRSALALTCGLLAGCAAPSAGPSPMAGDQNAAPKIDPAVKQAEDVVSDTKALATDPISLQRRRRAIAEMIEGRLAYDSRWVEGGAARLTDARFAGPYEYSYKYPFMDRVTETVYCASVDAHYSYFPFPYRYEAVIRVEKADAGSERLHAEVWERGNPRECKAAPYGPFPELDQARAKRRQSQGLPD